VWPTVVSSMEERPWVSDPDAIADQLIRDYRDGGPDQGNLDAVATMISWINTASFHGSEFTEDDWITLVQELARRAAWPDAP
ncbi:MAG: hypothetical protein ACKOB8_03970, partial [Mycobacterium sp.]